MQTLIMIYAGPARYEGEAEMVPGWPDESWDEIASASLDQDDLDHPRETHPPDPCAPRVI